MLICNVPSGIDALQQSVMGQNAKTSGQEAQPAAAKAPHEEKVDNMHPDQVSEFIRDRYKSTTAQQDREDKDKTKST